MTHTLRSRARALTILGGLAAAATLTASGPTTWTTSTQADFLKGQALGVSVDEAGRVVSGPDIALLTDAASPQVWSLAAAADDTWVAGTGGDGRVIRGRAGQVSTLLDSAEPNIYAVATAPDGRVFAASGPDGKVYAITPGGASSVFFDPAEKYIWALAVDGQGRLWVGAGTPAVIYRVDANGTSKAVYKPTANHVVALAIDNTGRVLAGTEGPGRLYRFDANDRPTALLDTGLAELRAISVSGDGTVYAAALANEGSSSDGPAAITSLGASTASTSAPATPSSSRKSVIFRLAANSIPEPLWETADIVYDISAGETGSVLAATGPDGHLFSIRANGSDVLINGVDARQVTRIAKSGARVLLASANPGRVHVMSGALASPGTFISPARDAKVTAAWGSIRWESTGPVALYTRTGNTDRADDSWSDWAGPYATASGSAITSPPGRYLQWKAVFTPGPASTPAALTSVSVGYLPANMRPVVTSITVHPPGAVFQKPFGEDGAIAGMDDADVQTRRAQQGESPAAAPALGRRMFQKGLQTLSWRAEDSDGDRLVYTLSYRREGETEWHILRDGMVDALTVWDTTTVPDGRYSLRVSASDAPSNVANRALAGQRESPAFEIDNTGPAIAIELPRPAAPNRLAFVVRDAQTQIDRVEYSIGGAPYQPLSPVDGVADSREERYELILPAGTLLSRVMIRATDAMQNTSTQAASIR
jgi:hypothetical protein